MRNRRIMGVALFCGMLSSLACGKKVPPAAAAAPTPPAVSPAPPAPPRTATVETTRPAAALTDDEIFARKTLDELNAERPLTDVWFDYDQWAIRDDARVSLQKNAEWLRRWPSTSIAIEGHTDDRGTGEYNLGLGERRAHAVKEYLASLGVAPGRLLVVSKGEETPMCIEAHESCWQQNRRGHPVITAK